MPGFPSFITLDYFTADGNVFHLDSQNWPRGPFQGNTAIEFGGEDDYGLPLTAQLPYGRTLMLTVASSTPLLTRDELRSNVAAYALRLGGAIENAVARGARVEVFVAIIHTAPPDEAAAQTAQDPQQP
ncbi:MAG: hypothetical protein AAGF49_00655 [Pseudomonadota bacterium]